MYINNKYIYIELKSRVNSYINKLAIYYISNVYK